MHSGPREPSGRSRRSTRYAMPRSVGSVSSRITSLRQPLEVLLVADRAAGVGLAVLLVQEDEVDVAGIVQLDAAQLAEAEHDEPAALAVGAQRLAVLLVADAGGRNRAPLRRSRRPGTKSAA